MRIFKIFSPAIAVSAVLIFIASFASSSLAGPLAPAQAAATVEAQRAGALPVETIGHRRWYGGGWGWGGYGFYGPSIYIGPAYRYGYGYYPRYYGYYGGGYYPRYYPRYSTYYDDGYYYRPYRAYHRRWARERFEHPLGRR